jgi:hypothetical protein
MSQLVKRKHQANFRDFKRFVTFKGLVEQKNVVLYCITLNFRGNSTVNNPVLSLNTA